MPGPLLLFVAFGLRVFGEGPQAHKEFEARAQVIWGLIFATLVVGNLKTRSYPYPNLLILTL